VNNDSRPETIQTNLKRFRQYVTDAPGDIPLYRQFDYILNDISTARKADLQLDGKTAGEILETVKFLVEENAKGRRPWTGNWEFYFEKCMENALRLLREYCSFNGHEKYVPKDYGKPFLDTLYAMDRFAEMYKDNADPQWTPHFARMASMAAEMFSLAADETAIIDAKALETTNKKIFAFLLIGFAKTGKAKELLLRYCDDEEAWVRDLALQLLHLYHE
jgi:hypothetical protein